MTAATPVARRKRPDLACPLFWKRAGNPLAVFFAAYPWGVVLCDLIAPSICNWLYPRLLPPGATYTPYSRTDSFSFTSAESGIQYSLSRVVDHDADVLFDLGYILILPALAWCVIMAAAATTGRTRWRLWAICLLLGLGGIAFDFWYW